MKWLKYVKPYWKYFLFAPLCMIVEVLGEVLMPKLYSQILNVGVETHNVQYIIATCALMVLTALLMIAVCKPLRFDAENAARIWKRDCRKHASPKRP